ncbi:MAG: hypothetical protein CSA66_01545 [Proteobacteria bacterium]|nr:MAG: hypothetical protein CSA66_01545 [Pseudomonadota bacterium]
MAAVAAGDEAAGAAVTSGVAGARALARLTADLAREGGTLTPDGPRVSVGGRALIGVVRRRPSGREARYALWADKPANDWQIVAASGEQPVGRAFLLRWLDGDTRFEDLPESMDGATWVTRLVAALIGGKRPSALLAPPAVEAEADVLAAALRRLKLAVERGGHTPDIAALGARVLTANGRVAAGLAVRSPDRGTFPVWLFAEPIPERDAPPRWRLEGSGGSPSLRGLVAGSVLDSAFDAAEAVSAAPAAVTDALDAALAGRPAPEALQRLDPRWLTLLGGLARSLNAPPPAEPALSDRPLAEGETPEDRGVAIVAELLRAAVIRGREPTE